MPFVDAVPESCTIEYDDLTAPVAQFGQYSWMVQ